MELNAQIKFMCESSMKDIQDAVIVEQVHFTSETPLHCLSTFFCHNSGVISLSLMERFCTKRLLVIRLK